MPPPPGSKDPDLPAAILGRPQRSIEEGTFLGFGFARRRRRLDGKLSVDSRIGVEGFDVTLEDHRPNDQSIDAPGLPGVKDARVVGDDRLEAGA